MTKRRTVLFSGDSVALVQNGEAKDANLCITFSPYDPNRNHQPTRQGFAEAFLADRNIPALHFIAQANHWWHAPDMAECVALAAPIAATAARRVGYGSSMGAYGCLRFADALGLDTIAAFAPQYSVDPAKVPWERRWSDDRNRITDFSGTLDATSCPQILVFCDPVGPDRRHIKFIEHVLTIHLISVPGCGHFVLKHLNACGVLGGMIQRIIAGTTDAATLQQEIALLPQTSQDA